MKRNRGFTVVELMLVFMIAGILIVVTVPVMKEHTKRAVLQEAVAGMRAIEAGQRKYFSMHNVYESRESSYGYIISEVGYHPSNPANPAWTRYPYGISAGQLDGIYFSEGCYRMFAMDRFSDGNPVTPPICSITCNVDPVWEESSNAGPNIAPKADIALRALGGDQRARLRLHVSGYGSPSTGEPGQIKTRYIPNSGFPTF